MGTSRISYVCCGVGNNNVVMVVFLAWWWCIIICGMTVDADGGNESLGQQHPLPLPLPARKKVAIEGVVYCLDCALNNHSQLVAIQTPVAGALLKLQCNNTIKSTWEQEIRTDSKGEFLLKTKKVTSWGIHKCKLFLLSSPQLNCNSTGNPYPEPDGTPWIFGRSLKPINTNKNNNNNIQFYTTHYPIFFYPHWSPCT